MTATLTEQRAGEGLAAYAPSKLAHVVLRTRANYDAMVGWYKTVLGAEIIFASDRITFITYDDEHHRIAITRADELTDRPHRAVGLDHIAFTYDGLDKLLGVYERLAKTGIEPFCCVNHGPTTSLYYADPDDNRIELQIDNFEHMHDATALMQDRFGVNPVGEEFDPAVLLQRLRSGEAAEDLVRPTGQPRPPEPGLISKLRSS
jgi:catechol-2,3-dioxygenase